MTETLLGVSPPSSKDPADSPSAEELAAAKELVRQARAQGVALTGPGGLLKALTKTVLETALEEEMAEHLGYDKHDPVGRNRGNSRNGKRAKTVLTDSGEVAVEVPRDRDGSFEPVIVAKRQRRLSSIDEIVLSLYARGLTTGDIAAHFADIYDAQVSKDTISRITDRVVEEMQAWTSRPLEPVYAAVVLDAINVKVRDGQVANRPVYAAIGVDLEGQKDILGMWFGDGGGESAKFWMVVLTELRNRGVADVFFLVCDGLKGLPDSVNAVWPATIVQTCLIHLIRNSFRFASRKSWDELSRDLKPIYTAVNAEAAVAALDDLHAKWGARYPAIIRLWRNAWAGSSGALLRRSPLRTGRASCPRIRLKQARWRRGVVLSGCCAARSCGRSGHERGVRRGIRSAMRVAGRR
jgi:putative transposase